MTRKKRATDALIKYCREYYGKQETCVGCTFNKNPFCRIAVASQCGVPTDWDDEDDCYAEKPPEGVSPYWEAIPRRIDNLAEAIKRYSGRKDGKVETWAAEIVALRKVQEMLDKEYGR